MVDETAAAPQWRLSLEVPAHAAAAFETALDTADSLAVLQTGRADRRRLEATFTTCPGMGRLGARLALIAAALRVPEPKTELERLSSTDWLGANRLAFPPVKAGRFVITGSYANTADRRAPAGHIGIRIERVTAFGTGEHPSTAGCLHALQVLARQVRPRRALDMGCGTGILAIAMARLWSCRVLAVDYDISVIPVARHNVQANRLTDTVKVAAADGYAARCVRERQPFDLIASNILARPLVRLSRSASRTLAPGGRLILSGFLSAQVAGVLMAHRRQGLRLERRFTVGAWTTLVMRRSPREWHADVPAGRQAVPLPNPRPAPRLQHSLPARPTVLVPMGCGARWHGRR